MKLFTIKLVTAVAGISIAGCLGYTLYEVGPGVVKVITSLSTDKINSLSFIGSIGVLALATSAIIAKPFDKLMDRIYPNDIPPKGAV